MKLKKDSIQVLLGDIKVSLKWVALLLLCFSFQYCAMHRSDLKLNIVNLSNDKVYIGELNSDCDSCDVNRDVRFQCPDLNSDPPMMRTINARDSIQLVDKLISNKIRMYVINADSLNQYCIRKQHFSIIHKSWVKTVTGNVDLEKKTCKIVIR